MPTQKGAISFGLVYIPVDLFTATQDTDVHFNQLAKESMQRVRYVKTCAGCEKELQPDDIVRGFKYGKDKYVVVSDEDLEKIKTEKDRSIQIQLFTDLEGIPSVYFERSYQVLPEKGGEKPFELLRQAMLQEKKVAVGKTVMGNNEKIVALIPTEEGMLMQTLYFAEEIKGAAREIDHPKVEQPQLDMAVELIQRMEKPFAPEEYRNEYQDKLKELIQNKIEGREIVTEKKEQPDNIINLMDALKASLEQQEEPPKKKTTRRKSKTG